MGLTIGQVAAQCGVGVETIRFYEREGLITQPSRPESGFRKYPPDAVRWVRFIQRSKALGFSLRQEMKRALVKLTAACRGKRPTSECPIMEALGDGG